MNFLTRKLLGRFGPAGRVADLAVVGGAGLKLAQRAGLINEDTAKRFGASTSGGGTSLSFGEMALLAMAIWRLVSQFRSRQKTETIIIDIAE